MRLRERHLGLNWPCHADWSAELTKTTGALVEEDDPEDSTTTTEATAEVVEGTTCLRIQGLQRGMRRRNDRPEELATMKEA